MKSIKKLIKLADAAGYGIRMMDVDGTEWAVVIENDKKPSCFEALLDPKPDSYHQDRNDKYQGFMNEVSRLGGKGFKGVIPGCSSFLDNESILQIVRSIVSK
jgi:hypothetical protein